MEHHPALSPRSRTLDPRSTLEKLRRAYLRQYLLIKGRNPSPQATAERMRDTIRGEGLEDEVSQWAVSGELDSRIRRFRDEHKATMDGTHPSPDISNMRMPDLRALAKRLGLDQKNTDSADDLRARIQEMMDGKDAA